MSIVCSECNAMIYTGKEIKIRSNYAVGGFGKETTVGASPYRNLCGECFYEHLKLLKGGLVCGDRILFVKKDKICAMKLPLRY